MERTLKTKDIVRRVLMIGVGLCLPLSIACGIRGSYRETLPNQQIDDVILTRHIEHLNMMVSFDRPRDTFRTVDKEVIAYLNLKDLSGSHAIRWDWIRPDNQLYCTTGDHELNISSGKYIRRINAVHRIGLNHHSAANYPGKWRVNVYLDDVLISSKSFKVKQAAPDTLFSENGKDVGGHPAEGRTTPDNTLDTQARKAAHAEDCIENRPTPERTHTKLIFSIME